MAIWAHRESVKIRRAASIGRQIIYPRTTTLVRSNHCRSNAPHPCVIKQYSIVKIRKIIFEKELIAIVMIFNEVC